MNNLLILNHILTATIGKVYFYYIIIEYSLEQAEDIAQIWGIKLQGSEYLHSVTKQMFGDNCIDPSFRLTLGVPPINMESYSLPPTDWISYNGGLPHSPSLQGQTPKLWFLVPYQA